MKSMGLRGTIAAALMGGALLTGGAQAGETWLPENFTASLSVTNDYVFRGISQTLSDPAVQFTGEWTPGGGPIYVGAFVSNIKFVDFANNRRLANVELDLLAGVRGEWSIVKWDLGAIAYVYPTSAHNSPTANTNFHFMEGALKTSWDIFGIFTAIANIYVSPQFQTDASTGVYMEGGVDYTTPWWEIALSARVARQNIENNNNFGTPDYWTWSFGVSKEFFGRVVVGAAYYDTDISTGRCFGGISSCEARGVGYVTFKF